MNHSKLYVPDPNLWIHFFKTKSEKKIINQKGGNNVLSTKTSTEPLNVELISQVEAGDERTASVINPLRKKSKPIKRLKKRINTKQKTHFIRRKIKLKTKRNKSGKRKRKPKSKRNVSHKRKCDIFSK